MNAELRQRWVLYKARYLWETVFHAYVGLGLLALLSTTIYCAFFLDGAARVFGNLVLSSSLLLVIAVTIDFFIIKRPKNER